MIWLVLLIVLVIFLVWYAKNKKKLVIECISFVNGGVKTGKSTLSVHLALKYYKKALNKWKIQKFFGKKREKPLLYSNIPLKCDYVLLSNEVLNRVKRIPYGSVVYIGEFTLVADNKFFKKATEEEIERLMLFVKLFGHETGGTGKCFIDTQCISDLPIDVRRCLNRYLWIERSYKCFPFFIIMKVKELAYSEDMSTVNINAGDVEDNTRVLLIPKSVWKKFDYCCYSSFTDNLPVSDKVVNGKKHKKLKVEKLPSFKRYATIPVYDVEEEEKKGIDVNGKQEIKPKI